MKLQRKMLLGSAVIVLTTVGLGGYTIRSITTMNRLMTTTYDNALMASAFSQSAHTAFIKSDRALKDALAAGSADDFDQAVAVSDEAERTFVEDLGVVQERALTDNSTALVAHIRELYTRWKPIKAGKVAAARAILHAPRKRGAAAALPSGLTSDEAKFAGLIEEKLEALTDQAAEAGYAFRESSRAVGRMTLYVAYAVVLVAIVVSFLVSIVLARGIVRPLRAISQRLYELVSGDGDLATRLAHTAEVPVRSRDEIGQLAKTFNATLMELRSHDQERQVREQGHTDLQRSITQYLEAVMEMARGDLTRRGTVTAGVLGNVVDAVNIMVEEIGAIIKDVRQAAVRVASSADEVIVSMKQMAIGAQEQSREAMSVSNAVEEMRGSVRQVAETAGASARAAKRALDNAQHGDTAVRNSLDRMREIRNEVAVISTKIKSVGDRSLEISEITSTIEDIAARTNLLALNAAIEAAAAGDAGNRFAVVAGEVRKLAELTTQATQDITTRIRNMQTEVKDAILAMDEGNKAVESGYQVMMEAGDSLKSIAHVSQESAELARNINVATQDQVRGTDKVAAAVQSIATVAVQTEQEVLRTRKTVEALVRLADELTASLARFKLAA